MPPTPSLSLFFLSRRRIGRTLKDDNERLLKHDSGDGEEELPARHSDDEEPQPHVKSLARQSRKKGAKMKKTTRSRLDASNLNLTDHRIYDASRMLARTAHPFISFCSVLDVKINELADKPSTMTTSVTSRPTISSQQQFLSSTTSSTRMTTSGSTKLCRSTPQIRPNTPILALIRTQIECLVPLAQTTSIFPRFHEKLKVDGSFVHTETRALLTAQDRCDELTNPRFAVHIETRALLTAQDPCDELTNPRDLKNRKISFTFEDYPALMYNQAKTDPEDGEVGLFEGHVPMHVLRTVLNGKSQAYTAASGIRGSNAKHKNIKTITGRLITYTHIQAYFACTTAEKWVKKVGTFDLWKWYDDMVEMFEKDAEDEKVNVIVELWNEEIFGTHRLQDISNRAANSNPNS
ncbi:hypothetical protein C8F01DRAFT_1319579 [Mycena amicta]|nr:hypothetical protein C8F01DRAFT_1319579 [Mycena amicta]